LAVSLKKMTRKVVHNVNLAVKRSDSLEESEWCVTCGPVSLQCRYAWAEMLYKKYILIVRNSKRRSIKTVQVNCISSLIFSLLP